jgi:hypothetical protein
LRLQSGELGSLTRTLVSLTLPLFLTVSRNVAVPPNETVCDVGFFWSLIDGRATGFGGVGGVTTVTCAEALALTLPPLGGVPVATAMFVKAAVTPSRRHV